MHTKKIIIAGILAAVTVGIYYFSADMISLNTREKEYKTYINKQFGFQLNYPSELFLNTFRTERGEVVRIAFSPEPERASEGDRFGTFTILIDSKRDLDTILNEYREHTVDTFETEDIFINGTPAKKITYRNALTTDIESSTLIGKNNYVLVITYWGNRKQERVFEKIVGSLQF